MCPYQESNLDLRFRKPPFYPLNYRDLLAVILSQEDLFYGQRVEVLGLNGTYVGKNHQF